MKIWIVVEIDHYGGDMSDCWCSFNNYNGLKVFKTEAEAEAEYKRLEGEFATSARIEVVEL